MTNLHLGGQRGDVREIERRCRPGVFEAAMDTCRTVGRAYGALHVGLDLAFTRDLASHVVLEANAFGDFLPGLMRDGLGIYDWEVRAAVGET
jgi:hypothetical protein